MAEDRQAVAPFARFARTLRRAGVVTTPDQLVTYTRALADGGPLERPRLYWVGRTCLVSRRDDLAAYDAAFEAWFDGKEVTLPPEEDEARADEPAPVTVAVDPGDGEEEAPSTEAGAVTSAVERLAHKDFADCSEEELATIQRALRSATMESPRRRSRRPETCRGGRRIALRQTMRKSLRQHGEFADFEHFRPRQRPRRIVLLLDVSGSMRSYSRVLLSVAQVMTRRGLSVETFCFGTRLTRVTRAMRRRHLDAAFEEAARRVVDWGGGTLIGESLLAFLRGWGRTSLARGAVVIICSDGLECGDPELLADCAARLERLAYRVIWLNPLLADPEYEPVARGMAAVLPSIDELGACHNLESVEGLLARLSEL